MKKFEICISFYRYGDDGTQYVDSGVFDTLPMHAEASFDNRRDWSNALEVAVERFVQTNENREQRENEQLQEALKERRNYFPWVAVDLCRHPRR